MLHWTKCPLLQPQHTQMPWTVLGKGPTYKDYVPEVDTTRVFSLNDVVKHTKVGIAHFIDVEALDRVIDYVESNSMCLILKANMHIEAKPRMKKVPAQVIVSQRPILKHLEQANRIYYYHRASKRNTHEIYIKHFSAEAAFQLLAKSGVKTVYTYGVNCNHGYASEFQNTLSTHSKKGYNVQENEIKHTCNTFNVNWIRR